MITNNRFALILASSVALLLIAGTDPACAADPPAAVPQAAEPAPGGPGTIQLDQLEGPYGPVTFDHAKHVTSYAEGCGDCHHQHRDYDSNPCKRCHSIDAAQFKESVKRNFGACGKCHGDYDVTTPEVPDLKVAYHQVCFSCHRERGDVGKSPLNCEELCHTKK